MNMKKSAAQVWQIGLSSELISYIETTFGVRSLEVPATPEKIMGLMDPLPEVILVGEVNPPQVKTELIQSLWLKCKNSPVFQVVTEARKFDRNSALSTGTKEIFFLPYEKVFFEDTLMRYLGLQETAQKRLFESVRLTDIDPKKTLTFDIHIFLKANRKFVCMAKKGQAVGPERMEQLKEKMSVAYVDSKESAELKDFIRESLKKRQVPQTTSATENKERLFMLVRTLVCLFFSPQKATANIEIPKKIEDIRILIRKILSETTFENWGDRLIETSGDRLDMSYNHACNVALYAAFFSMGTNVGVPEDMAVAGVLHDIGLALVGNSSIFETDIENMTQQQKAIHNMHVQKILAELNARNINIGRVITAMIQQHHELYNGKGYPAGLSGKQILPEAQILALADRMDELTSYTDQREGLTPKQALYKIVIEDQKKQPEFSPEILVAMDELSNETLSKKQAS